MDVTAPDALAGGPAGGAAGEACASAGPCDPSKPAPDVDLDALAVRLDAHSRALRGDLLEYFLQLKERQLQRQCQAVHQQRAEDDALLAAKQQELEGALQQLEAQRQRGRRLTTALERAVYKLHKQSQLRKHFALLARAWRAWLGHTRRERRVRANMVAAARHYDVGKLTRAVLRAWRGLTSTERRERLKRDQEENSKAVQQQIWQQANAINEELSQRLAELEGELDTERRARARLEEDMKRAFMRGVCALNIEAMALMKNGTPLGGVSPFPDVSNQQQQGGLEGDVDAGESSRADATTSAAAAEAATIEPWLISSLAAPQDAALLPDGAAACLWPWPHPAPSAKPALPALAASYMPPALYSPAPQQPPEQPMSGRLPAGPATVVIPRAPTQMPHPIIKVAPTHPVEFIKTEGNISPRAVRSPSVLARPAAPVPSNLRNNVPEHIAAAVLRRPQTAAAASSGPTHKAARDPRRPATGTGTTRPGKGGLSQRSLAVRKGSGSTVIRGPLHAAGEVAPHVTSQDAAALRRSMLLPGKPGAR